jgi:ABC-type glutathione transport system ATPase component
MLKVEQLHIHYGKAGSAFHAVKGVDLDLNKGQTLGLVGESGSGKSSIARALVGLIPSSSGRMQFNGQELTTLSARAWKPVRKQIQLIFQDPYASLNPRLTLEEILREPLRIHYPEESRLQHHERIDDLLQRVGLDPSRKKAFPDAFSGGQRQRMVIARALAVEPQLLICDEPVSALDVTIQAQILNLLKDLQEQMGLTMLFISHDLAVVEFMCDRVAVMQEGVIVEEADAAQIYGNPQHDYTQMLLKACLEGI